MLGPTYMSYPCRCPLLTMMQPEPVVSSSPNSLHGRGGNEDSGNAVAAAVAAAVEDSQQLVLGCGGGGNGSGSGNFISNHPQQQAAQYKGDEIAAGRCRMQSLFRRQLYERGQYFKIGLSPWPGISTKTSFFSAAAKQLRSFCQG